MNLGFINSEDPHAVRRAFQTIQGGLGYSSSPIFAGLTITGLTANSLMYSASGGVVTSLGAATNGQIPIGSTGAVPVLATITGTANEIDVTNGAGSITIGLVNPLIVGKGGTGAATLTDHSLLVGSGTDAVTALGVATNGQLPIGSTGADPTLATITGTANEIEITNGAGSITIGLVDPLIVAKGGTGAATLTDHSLLVGSGTDAVTALGAATNGQLPIGSTGADPVLATLTGTANQVNVTNDAGSITLSTPQNIHATADVEFQSLLIDQDTDAIGLNIDSEATTAANYGLQCVTGGGAIAALISCGATANGAFYAGCPNNQSYAGSFVFVRDLAAASTDGSVVYIHQDNAGDDQPALEILQDGTGYALLATGNVRFDGDATITGTTTYEGNIVIPDAGYIGSASDTDAIQIEADGDVVVSQMLAVTGDIQVTGNILLMADRGGLGYSDNNPMIVFDDTNNRVEFVGNIMLADDGTIGVADGEPSILFDNTDGQVEVTGILTVSSNISATGTITASNYTAANLLTACATNAGALDFSAASKTLTVEDDAVVSQDYSSDASPTFAGLDLTNITDGNIPYMSASGFADSPISYNGTAIVSGGNSYSAANPSIILTGTLSGANSGHGFTDEKSLSLDDNTKGYASFDAYAEISGSGDLDHYNSFQARSEYKSTGTIDYFRGLRVVDKVYDGTVTNYIHVDIAPRSKDGGTITNEYGLKIASIAQGDTLNYAIYTGNGYVYFGDNVGIGTAIQSNRSLSLAGDIDVGDCIYIGGTRFMFKEGTNGFAHNAGSDGIRFKNANTEKMRINANGVGVGEGVDPVTQVEVVGTSPYVTLHNSTSEDGDGGRESRIIARGQQNGDEETVLGYLEFAHDGAADDEKGLFRVLLNDGDDGTAPSLTALTCHSTGEVKFHQTVYFASEVDNGDSGAADTIDWTAGNKQKSTLTGNCTFTFSPEPSGPSNLTLKLKQDDTGSRTVTWPGDVKWAGGAAPTLSTGANDVDIISFYYDGTDFYGQAALDFG